MAKWILASLVFLGASVHAHELQPQNDGCALLEEIIYEEVTAAAWGLDDARLRDLSASGAVVCTHTTHTASLVIPRALQFARRFSVGRPTHGQDVATRVSIGGNTYRW